MCVWQRQQLQQVAFFAALGCICFAPRQFLTKPLPPPRFSNPLPPQKFSLWGPLFRLLCPAILASVGCQAVSDVTVTVSGHRYATVTRGLVPGLVCAMACFSCLLHGSLGYQQQPLPHIQQPLLLRCHPLRLCSSAIVGVSIRLGFSVCVLYVCLNVSVCVP